MLRCLVVGDLHLMDNEIKSTKKAVENNQVMLDSIYSHVLADDEIGMVFFLGDIQHKTPRNLKETFKWRSWFRKLNTLLSERPLPNGKIVGKDGSVLPLSRVISLKGNHDAEIFNQRKTDFTFFDELLSEGLIVCPSKVVLADVGDKPVVFNCLSYGEASLPLADLGDRVYTVTLTHDTLYHENSSDFVKRIVELSGGVLADSLGKVSDLMINGHLHSHFPFEKVGRADFINLGSMARTSISPESLRDVGYALELDFCGGKPQCRVVQLPVIPHQEYFNLKEYLRKKHIQSKHQDFTLGEVNESVGYDFNVEERVKELESVFGESTVSKTLELLRLAESLEGGLE